MNRQRTLKLHHRVQGEGEDILLIHGLFGSMENLGAIARLLSNQFTVHSLDMRNHGRSPHHDLMSYDLMAADIMQYLKSAKLDKVHLLGHSMGGKVAMQFALSNAGRVKTLIVADIAPVAYPPRHSDVFDGLLAINPNELKSRTEADNILREYVKETAVRQFLMKNLVKSAPEGFCWRMNLNAIHNQYQQLMAGQHSETPFSGPVLFIKGGNSDYIQNRHKEQIETLFPSVHLRVIPNTGHWLHAEKPELFARVVKRFLGVEDNA